MEEKSTNSKKKIVIVAIILCLLAVAIGGLFYYFKFVKGNDNVEETSAETTQDGIKDLNESSNNGRIELLAKDQDDLEVVGIEVKLEKKDGTLIGNVEVGTDGKITFYNVPQGDYVISETKTVEGYAKTEKTIDVSVKPSETSTVTMNIERITGVLNITLMDDSKNLLKSGTFNLYDSEGYLITTARISVDGGAKLNVGYGTYYFKQASGPEKYIIDDTMYKFTVDEENRIFNQTVTNIRYKGIFLLELKDTDGNAVEGISFNIFNENGDLINNLKTNNIGRAGIANVPSGKYTVKVSQIPDGLKLSEEKFEFEITEHNQKLTKNITVEKNKTNN